VRGNRIVRPFFIDMILPCNTTIRELEQRYMPRIHHTQTDTITQIYETRQSLHKIRKIPQNWKPTNSKEENY